MYEMSDAVIDAMYIQVVDRDEASYLVTITLGSYYLDYR